MTAGNEVDEEREKQARKKNPLRNKRTKGGKEKRVEKRGTKQLVTKKLMKRGESSL